MSLEKVLSNGTICWNMSNTCGGISIYKQFFVEKQSVEVSLKTAELQSLYCSCFFTVKSSSFHQILRSILVIKKAAEV